MRWPWSPPPIDEAARLRELAQYRLMDTDPEARFDTLVRVVANLCEVPAAMISLVEGDRDWKKSLYDERMGVPKQQPAEDSFCRIALNDPKHILEVFDATLDARFAHYAPVRAGLRFYAGKPLVNARGTALGVLCVVDTEPRELSDEQRQCLLLAADLMVAEMELRRASLELNLPEAASPDERVARREALIRLISNCSLVEVRLAQRYGLTESDRRYVTTVRERLTEELRRA